MPFGAPPTKYLRMRELPARVKESLEKIFERTMPARRRAGSITQHCAEVLHEGGCAEVLHEGGGHSVPWHSAEAPKP